MVRLRKPRKEIFNFLSLKNWNWARVNGTYAIKRNQYYRILLGSRGWLGSWLKLHPLMRPHFEMLNMKGFLKLVPYVLYVQGCGEISELSMMMAGVVLIQHPLHLLLLKVALAGLLSVQHWADGRIGFCRALHRPTAMAVYRYASSFQPSAKDLVMARDSSLDDAAALEKTKIRALNPQHAWWNGQVTPSQSQVPLRQMQKTIFFLDLFELWNKYPTRAMWWCYGE